MLAPNHQRIPQPQHVDTGLDDPAEVEELRLAEGAMVMVHRHFDDAEAGILDLLHHLQTDDARGFFEVDALEDGAPHQAEVAVDVADGEAEHPRHEMVIRAADDDSVKWIRAAD